MIDNFGIEIRPTDHVRVMSYGYGARVVDCGTSSPVVRINRIRLVIIDADGRERAVSPATVGVLRRGEPANRSTGYEANRT